MILVINPLRGFEVRIKFGEEKMENIGELNPENRNIDMVCRYCEIDGNPGPLITTNICYDGKYEKELIEIMDAFEKYMDARQKNQDVASGRLEIRI